MIHQNRAETAYRSPKLWSWTTLEQIGQDFRFASHILTRSPWLSVAAISLIALGIGGNTTLLSIMNGILNKPAPGVQSRGLVSLGLSIDGEPSDPANSYLNYRDYVTQVKSLQSLAARQHERLTMELQNGVYALSGSSVSENYFDTLGVKVSIGRVFHNQNETELEAVISYQLWNAQFSKSDSILGRRITLNGHSATIVGVTPPGFRGTQLSDHVDVWLPLVTYTRIKGTQGDLNDRAVRELEMTGRLASGYTLRQARAEFETVSSRLAAAYPDTNKGKTVLVAPYSPTAVGPANQSRPRMFMAILAAVALLTILVVCANVANLMLARAMSRQHDVAVRQSLGAPRSRILRVVIAEGFILSFIALVAAAVFAYWASAAIVRLLPPNSQGVRLEPDLTPDARVWTFAIVLAVGSALVSTVAPALRSAWREKLGLLRSGERNIAHGRSRVSSALVVIQLALCVLLLTAAGLANRSLSLINDLDLHYNPDNLLLTTINTATAANSKERNLILLEAMRERLAATPQVESVSYVQAPIPFSWGSAPLRLLNSTEPVNADLNYVGAAFLETLGVRPLLGTGFATSESASTRHTAFINQNLANALWPGQHAVGRILLLGKEKQATEVIGVIPNAFFGDLRDLRPNYVFLQERDSPAGPGEITFLVRYRGGSEAAAATVRSVLGGANVRVPIVYLRTMRAQLDGITAPARAIAYLLSIFGVGALVIAAGGLYAVIAFNVSKRLRDFGIRMSLGATAGNIQMSVLKESVWLTVGGFLCGAALSMIVGRAFRSLLFGVKPLDGLTYVGVFAVVALIAVLAGYVPARRASRVDPVEALRSE